MTRKVVKAAKAKKGGVKELIAALYHPCRNCGHWRRQHLGKEKKCLFQASNFEPKFPPDFTTKERVAMLDRAERLDQQMVERVRQRVDALEEQIGKLNDAARQGCPHVDDNGMGLLERHAPHEGEKYHVICSLCQEDWYEDEEGKKLEPAPAAGSGE